ncbi:hypothetical protein AB840_12310 [Megasphaera cerevisiae DSM 20462]|uniref:Copper amine oxidase-like N-terminal domain-containing protein n=2 Tax=Megasphaera TaxID=906 RepID=A0A0J6WV51_9FIRM|nr:hypothetical protein AB840_12310 [Megasphaera cerevisiae DSM 20462]
MGLSVYAENTADTVVEITQNTAGPQEVTALPSYRIIAGQHLVDTVNLPAPVFQKRDILLIPLRKVAEQLGYAITWDSGDGYVRMETTVAYMLFKPGEDWYERIGTLKTINLNHIYQYGTAPVNIDGTMYVPAQVFREFFNTVTIDNDQITISPQNFYLTGGQMKM